MKIVELKGNRIEIDDVKKPSLNDPNQKEGAIVKILGCGLCGSDIVKYQNYINQDKSLNQSIRLGHEIVGIIEEINSKTDFKVNDKIVLGHHIPCFNCVYCKGKSYSMCKEFKSSNITPCGFSEYIYITEKHLENTVFKVPEKGISDIEVSFTEPLGCCIRAIERAQLENQSNVLVIGLGTIGILMSQALKFYNNKVIATDLIESRINLAKDFGIENSFNGLNSEEKIMELSSNIGVDAIFMTSGSAKAIDQALKLVRDGGKIIVFSSIKNNDGYINNEIYYRELSVIGAYSASPDSLRTAFNLITTHKINVEKLSTVYNFKNIQNAIDDTINNKIMKAYIKI